MRGWLKMLVAAAALAALVAVAATTLRAPARAERGGIVDREAPMRGEPASTAAPLGAGSVTGVVLADGKPVPGVTVSLVAEGLAFSTAVTDVLGRYRLAVVDPSMYTVAVEVPKPFDSFTAYAPLRAGPGYEVEWDDIHLIRGLRILEPRDGATLALPLIVRWDAVTDAQLYSVSIFDQDVDGPPVFDRVARETGIVIGALSAGRYLVRVDAIASGVRLAGGQTFIEIR